MLVYGDVVRDEEAAALRADILRRLRRCAGMPAGLPRHAALVAAFMRTSDLVQGLVDRDFRANETDEPSPVALRGMAILAGLAQAVDRSWRTAFAAPLDLHDTACAIERLTAVGSVRTKPAEGYAFYAVYPESFADAARASGLPPSTRVIGIRSIGVSLAAMVAAALGAAPPVTVRPVGHPFDRRLSISPALADDLLAGGPPAFAVVDEGPGLSGSSFAAVAGWLEQHGVTPERIHFFPSHGNGPGAMAGAAARQRWSGTARHVPDPDAITRPGGQLEQWVAALLGPLDAPLDDISAGAWRRGRDMAKLPAAPSWERRKFLAHRRGEPWLVKFSGLGDEGERKLALAHQLHAAGFGPETAGLCHGYLVQRWVEGSNLAVTRLDRGARVAALARYLAFRAGCTAELRGASFGQLNEMAIHNTVEALGAGTEAPLETRLAGADTLASLVRPVEVDARLHVWEWLVDTGGGLIKTDALDHARAHDFIGAQDIAWDIAGATVEHGLSARETEDLIAALEREGHAVNRQLLALHTIYYLAFQLGAWTMSVGADAPVARRYARRLRLLLTS